MNAHRIYVKIYTGDSIYERLTLTPASVQHIHPASVRITTSKLVHFYRLRLTGVTLHFLIKALAGCQQCRDVVTRCLLGAHQINRVRIHLLPLSSCPDTIDYNWNEKCYYMARERAELDHTLSWLSTLGGAFSALGDYFATCAETAAKISVHQFQLALRMDDPGIAARCRLYFALSLIQRKHFRLARSVIQHEYSAANDATSLRDPRLIKMCLGIWSKLKYEWSLHRKAKSHQNAIKR